MNLMCLKFSFTFELQTITSDIFTYQYWLIPLFFSLRKLHFKMTNSFIYCRNNSGISVQKFNTFIYEIHLCEQFVQFHSENFFFSLQSIFCSNLLAISCFNLKNLSIKITIFRIILFFFLRRPQHSEMCCKNGPITVRHIRTIRFGFVVN